jgi:hypothetical protein
MLIEFVYILFSFFNQIITLELYIIYYFRHLKKVSTLNLGYSNNRTKQGKFFSLLFEESLLSEIFQILDNVN